MEPATLKTKRLAPPPIGQALAMSEGALSHVTFSAVTYKQRRPHCRKSAQRDSRVNAALEP
jgi:hypothetical protein